MRYLVLTVFYYLLITSCEKPYESDLPSQAETGSDFLWCKVNGEAHLYKGKPTGIRHNGVHAYKQKYADSNVFIIIRGEDSKYSDGLDMCVNVTVEAANTPLVNKKYKISDGLPYIYSEYYTTNDSKSYKVDSNRSHMIFTSFDNDIAAGTFEYHGFNKDNDTVHITEGFFNIVRE